MKYKNLLIYGGSSQIPIELINIYIEEFDKIFVIIRSQKEFSENLQEFKKFEDNLANKIISFEADLINLDQVLGIINTKVENLSGLIWYAGMTGNSDKEYLDYNLASYNLKINFLHPILIINEISKKIIENKNSFIAIFTSVAGKRGRSKQLFYGPSKSGLINYSSALRQKLNKKKIQVLTVIPGYMNTKPFRKLNITAPNFLISSPKNVAKIIKKAVTNQKDIVYINSIWKIIMLTINLIPEKIFKRLSFWNRYIENKNLIECLKS